MRKIGDIYEIVTYDENAWKLRGYLSATGFPARPTADPQKYLIIREDERVISAAMRVGTPCTEICVYDSPEVARLIEVLEKYHPVTTPSPLPEVDG